MENLPTRNQNPGDLKDPSTGTFRKFNSAQEGFDALKNDLQLKISGKSTTGVTPDSDLLHFSSIYAPSSDKNDPVQYAQNLSQKLGVPVNTPIKDLSSRLDDFASAIADNEGYQGNRVSGTSQSVAPAQGVDQLSSKDFAEKIKTKYPQYKDIDDDQLTQKIIAKYPQYKSRVSSDALSPQKDSNSNSNQVYTPAPVTSTGDASTEKKPGFLQGLVQDITSPFTQGITSVRQIKDLVTGNKDDYQKTKDGINYGFLGNQKAIGDGFDITKPVSQNIKPLFSAATQGAKVAGDIVGGEGAIGAIRGLIGGGTALGSDVAQSALENYALGPGENVANLTSADKVNAITNALGDSVTSPAEKEILQQALQEAKSGLLKEAGIGSWSELNPAKAKAIGLTWNIAKKAAHYGLEGLGLFEGANFLKGLLK